MQRGQDLLDECMLVVSFLRLAGLVAAETLVQLVAIVGVLDFLFEFSGTKATLNINENGL